MRLKTLKEIEKDKARVAKAYNEKVRSKSFQVGDWCGKPYYQLDRKAISLASGHRIGKVLTKWSKLYLEIHMC